MLLDYYTNILLIDLIVHFILAYHNSYIFRITSLNVTGYNKKDPWLVIKLCVHLNQVNKLAVSCSVYKRPSGECFST